MIKKKSLLLSGYYGMNNYGDDLFGIASVKGIKQFSPSLVPKVLSTPIKHIDTDCVIPSWVPENIYNSQDRLGGIARLLTSYWYAHKERNVVFAGGSLFNNAPQGMTKFLSKSPFLTFGAIGVSLGPYKSSEHERLSKEFIKRFKFLTLRDTFSYELVKSWGIDIPIGMYGDLAGVIPKLNLFESEIEPRPCPIIGVSMCNFETFHGGDIKQELARIKAMSSGVVDVAKKTRAEIHIFSFNNHPIVGDDKVHQQFISVLESEGIKFKLFRNSELGALDLWHKVRQCNAFMSIRLHGAITAYLNKVPFVLVEYHKKCTDFLDDIGHANQYRILPKDYEPKSYSACLERILNKDYSYPAYDSNCYAEKAIKHFSFLYQD